MILFPFCVDVENMRFLVIGGGNVARRKVEKLRMFTDRITVVAEKTDITEVEVINRAFSDDDLDEIEAVICATDDSSLNHRIAGLCHERRIPVNSVDAPEDCTFIFPALIRRGSLTVSVTTDGKSPILAGMLREKIESILPNDLDVRLDRAGELRKRLRGGPHDLKQWEQLDRAAAECLNTGEG